MPACTCAAESTKMNSNIYSSQLLTWRRQNQPLPTDQRHKYKHRTVHRVSVRRKKRSDKYKNRQIFMICMSKYPLPSQMQNKLFDIRKSSK